MRDTLLDFHAWLVGAVSALAPIGLNAGNLLLALVGFTLVAGIGARAWLRVLASALVPAEDRPILIALGMATGLALLAIAIKLAEVQ